MAKSCPHLYQQKPFKHFYSGINEGIKIYSGINEDKQENFT